MLFQPVNPLVTRLQYIYLSNEAGLISKIFSSIQTINNKWIINFSPRIIGNFKKNWDRVFEQQHDSNIVKSDGVFGNDFKIMFLDEHRTCKFFSTVCTEPSIKIKLCIWCYNGKGDGECVALNFSKSKTMTLENVFARYSDVERWTLTYNSLAPHGQRIRFANKTKLFTCCLPLEILCCCYGCFRCWNCLRHNRGWMNFVHASFSFRIRAS